LTVAQQLATAWNTQAFGCEQNQKCGMQLHITVYHMLLACSSLDSMYGTVRQGDIQRCVLIAATLGQCGNTLAG
jgi:hypothetical protein